MGGVRIEKVDQNADGKITFEEIQQAAADGIISTSQATTLAFEGMDAGFLVRSEEDSGDSYITREENPDVYADTPGGTREEVTGNESGDGGLGQKGLLLALLVVAAVAVGGGS